MFKKETAFHLGVVLHTWNPNTREAEAGGLLV